MSTVRERLFKEVFSVDGVIEGYTKELLEYITDPEAGPLRTEAFGDAVKIFSLETQRQQDLWALKHKQETHKVKLRDDEDISSSLRMAETELTLRKVLVEGKSQSEAYKTETERINRLINDDFSHIQGVVLEDLLAGNDKRSVDLQKLNIREIYVSYLRWYNSVITGEENS